MQIEQTTNYRQFKNIQGNRAINEAHVAFLIQSIGIRNLLQYAPIIVNEKMEIIDGQHRLKAAQEMSLPIFYMQVQGATIREVQLLNATNRAWKMEDFLEAYCIEGLPEYLAVREFMQRTGYRLGAALYFLSKKIKRRMSNNVKSFKSGTFKIVDRTWADAAAAFIAAYHPYIMSNVRGDRHFIHAMLIIFDKQAKILRLVDRAEKQAIKLTRQVNVSEYLRQLEETYNYGWKYSSGGLLSISTGNC